LRRYGARLRAAARALVRSPPQSLVPVAVSIAGGAVDEILITQGGHVEVVGWSDNADVMPPLEVHVNGVPARDCGSFRLPRPDVLGALQVRARLPGFVQRFAAPAEIAHIKEVTLWSAGQPVARIGTDVAVHQPDYSNLFDELRVLHREQLYGVGPPAPEANADVVALARQLPGPVLDFGCGSGALVRALRGLGLDACGIELSRPEILESVTDDVRPFITMYDGTMPLPFRDGQFESVVCSEVLEHIPDYALAVREMARVAGHALITVPDMSAVPALHPHFVIPWHLLEATHVNFFTQSSLHALLRRSFRRISFSRLGPFEVNGTRVFTSIVAFCADPAGR